MSENLAHARERRHGGVAGAARSPSAPAAGRDPERESPLWDKNPNPISLKGCQILSGYMTEYIAAESQLCGGDSTRYDNGKHTRLVSEAPTPAAKYYIRSNCCDGNPNIRAD